MSQWEYSKKDLGAILHRSTDIDILNGAGQGRLGVDRNLDHPHYEAIAHEARVDSGSDFCIFPGQLAPLLAIDIKSGKELWVSGVVEGERPPSICTTSNSTSAMVSTARVG